MHLIFKNEFCEKNKKIKFEFLLRKVIDVFLIFNSDYLHDGSWTWVWGNCDPWHVSSHHQYLSVSILSRYLFFGGAQRQEELVWAEKLGGTCPAVSRPGLFGGGCCSICDSKVFAASEHERRQCFGHRRPGACSCRCAETPTMWWVGSLHYIFSQLLELLDIDPECVTIKLVI